MYILIYLPTGFIQKKEDAAVILIVEREVDLLYILQITELIFFSYK
jgi:hypothetical protein